MTQEEKDLLLKDLCARLPYGVKVSVQSYKGTFIGTLVTVTTKLSNTLGEAWIEETDEALWCDYSLFKPYLRPMSSMTEEEKQQYWDLCYQDQDDIWGKCRFDRIVDFCLKKHLDFRSLIEKGLALVAPKGMYQK